MGDENLDVDQWRTEAEAVIGDIKKHVKSIELSDKLPSSHRCVYLNLTTLESSTYCVELSPAGFRIVDNRHDANYNRRNETFETPYSLLESISPLYVTSFGAQLYDKLKNLEQQQQQ